MPPWTRASELHRAIPCPASAVLPRAQDPSGPGAVFGTALHAWKAGATPTGDRGGVAAWLTRQPDPDPRPWLWPGGHHEVLLWSPSDRRPVHPPDPDLSTKEQRDAFRANLPSHTVAGEADWICLDGPAPWVDDLKTGQWPGPPSSLAQLRFYAWCLADLQKAPEILVSITHWPRYPLGTPPARTTEVLTRDELRGWAAQLTPPRLPVLPQPGPHCQWCRCICPENPVESRRPHE